MHIDSFAELVNTYGQSRIQKVLQETGKMLAADSRGGDIMISAGEGDFLVLLPDTAKEGAVEIAERIRKSLVQHMFPELENDCVHIVYGVAAYPAKKIASPVDLLAAASHALSKVKNKKNKVLTA